MSPWSLRAVRRLDPKSETRGLSMASAESTVLFVLGAGACLAVATSGGAAGHADWQAISALSHALDVVHKEPRFNLALIGFSAPPLPALVELPLAGVVPALAVSGFACSLVGALMLGGCLVMLNSIAAWVGLRPWLRWLLCGALAAHPLIFTSGTLGSPLIIWALAVLCATGALMRWAVHESFRDLLSCSLFVAAAILTRYEAAWLAISAAGFVVWRIRKDSGDWAKVEGTVIAFLLPVAYVAGVWIAANWAIMGDPWHFLRTVGAVAGTAAVEPTVWFTGVGRVALICFPLLVGLLVHELCGGQSDPGRAPAGQAAGWLSVGIIGGAALTPWLYTGDSLYTRLGGLGVTVIVTGSCLLALALASISRLLAGTRLDASEGSGGLPGEEVPPRRPIQRPGPRTTATRVISAALALLGVLGAAWLLLTGPSPLPSPFTPGTGSQLLQVGDVSAERQIGRAVGAALPTERKAYLVGGPGYAVSLFSGRPASVVLVRQAGEDLPLEVRDLVVLHETQPGRLLAPTLQRRGLALTARSAAGGGRWRLYEVVRPEPARPGPPTVRPSAKDPLASPPPWALDVERLLSSGRPASPAATDGATRFRN